MRIHTSTSRRVKVKSTFGAPPCICMRRSSASIHGSSATAQLQLSWSAGRLRQWGRPSAGLKHSVATSTVAVGSWASIQGPYYNCTNDSACRRRSERSKEQEDLRPARPRACMRKARIARKDVNFEAPFGGLGNFSCKRSFLLEECLLRATISVVNKDRAIKLRGGRTLLTCHATSLPVGRLFYRTAMAVGPAGLWKKQFRLRKIWLTFITFCGYLR